MDCKVNGFKFKRSGIFGKGDYVDVYNPDGEKIDRFELERECNDMSSFKSECRNWYVDNDAWEL